MRRQADQAPGQFDLLGQVLSSFRKFYSKFNILINRRTGLEEKAGRERGRDL